MYVFTDHVEFSQSFVQGELVPWDGHNGNVYFFSPPGYEEDSPYMYRLFMPLHSMPSAVRAWHTMISIFLEIEACETVGFEKSMWRVVVDRYRILFGTHIDDFANSIRCAHQ